MAVIYSEVPMPLSNVFRRLKAETSTLDDLSAELGRQDRIRLDAENALHDLGARRPALLIDGTDAQLAKLDADLAMHRRAQEQAAARIEALTPEWQEADRRETEARLDRERRERHAAAVKARTEGRKILQDYDRDAAALAAKLRRLVAIEAQIAEADRDLPPDAAPIGSAEPFNGRHPTPDVWPEIEVWAGADGSHHGHAPPGARAPFPGAKRVVTRGYTPVPGSLGFPHRPLAGRVHLPAVDLAAPAYWAPGVAAAPAVDARAAFLIQRGIRP